jgi:hypothetical protein
MYIPTGHKLFDYGGRRGREVLGSADALAYERARDHSAAVYIPLLIVLIEVAASY